MVIVTDYYLRTWNDPILRKKCREVKDFSNLDPLIYAMHSIMSEYNNVGGIAAPQVGDDRQVILALIGNRFQALVNPVIYKAWRFKPSLEACLSFPGKGFFKMRKSGILVEYQTTTGETRNEKYNGLSARILQHEIDHLNGIVLYNGKNPERK